MRRIHAWLLIGFFSFAAVVGGLSYAAFAQGKAVSEAAAKSGDEAKKECCAYVGIYMDDLTQQMKEELRYPHENGVVITGVENGSPAEKAGLAKNDIVYLFDGRPVENASQIAERVKAQKPGDRVVLVVYRDGDRKKIAVTLGKRETPTVISGNFGVNTEQLNKAMREADKTALNLYRESFMTRGRLGMALHDLNEGLAGYFGVKKDQGVLVLDVQAGSPAEIAGVKAGDVIVALDGKSITSVQDFRDTISDLAEGDTVSVEVVRKGASRTIELAVSESPGSYRFRIAPFERSGPADRSLERYFLLKSDETAKLEEEMKVLKHRLQELEERLDEAQKKGR
jgi:predicted metalloprotease with PDZ domain